MVIGLHFITLHTEVGPSHHSTTSRCIQGIHIIIYGYINALVVSKLGVSGHFRVLEWLLSLDGADPGLMDCSGQTAACVAAATVKVATA